MYDTGQLHAQNPNTNTLSATRFRGRRIIMILFSRASILTRVAGVAASKMIS